MAATSNKKQVSNGVPQWLWKLLAGIVVTGGGFLVGRKILRDIRERNAQNHLGEDTPKGRASAYATFLNAAMNPSGFPYLFSYDGTSTDEMYKTAIDIFSDESVDFDLVIKMYRKLFTRNLLTDLQAELDIPERKEFDNLLQTGKSLQGIGAVTRPKKIFATQDTEVMNSIYQFGTTVKSKQFLGYQTSEKLYNHDKEIVYIGFDNNGQDFYIDQTKAVSVPQ